MYFLAIVSAFDHGFLMSTPSLPQLKPRRVLVRSTNWIGDAVMTTPAVRTIRQNFPEAEISILVHPWVADIFVASPHVDNIIHYDKKGRHAGLAGMLRLGRELRERKFGVAILLQNAFEAAFIAWRAAIPCRAGYRRDCRGPLLTHGVGIPAERRKVHQVHYYQGMLQDLGLKKGPDGLFLNIPDQVRAQAKKLLAPYKAHGPVVGLNPGAAYGPAKRWPAEKFGMLAKTLRQSHGAVCVVFGTDADAGAANIIKAAGGLVVDMTGKTELMAAMALIEGCDAFVTNDSGLMHVAAALETPLAAIFGSTDHVATGPFSSNARIIRKDIPCSPCLRPDCKKDFACMESIGVDEVAATVAQLLSP